MNSQRVFVTLPTAGRHPEILNSLLEQADWPRERTVIVSTSPDVHLPAEICVIEDFGGINIQRWWNRGIEVAVRRGASVVIVMNDDVSVTWEALTELATELELSGCTLASPGSKRKAYKGIWPLRRVLDGSLWALKVSDGLRPDEDFAWGYGDDDLDWRARRHFRGVVTVPIAFEHLHHNQATSQSPTLLRLSLHDRETFKVKHGVLFRVREPRLLAARWARRLGLHK